MGRCCSCTCSGAVLAVLNLLTLLIALAMLGAGAQLAARSGTACERFLESPLVLSGAFLLAVALLGLVGYCCRVGCLLWFYLAVTFLLIVALACFTALAFVATNRAAGRAVAGQGYGRYRVGDYSRWLQKLVTDEKIWANIESCLKEAKVCGGPRPAAAAPQPLGFLDIDPSTFYKTRLASIQSGCCKRPPGCDGKAPNGGGGGGGSVVTVPARTLLDGDGDCEAWSGDRGLCFGCGSCKAGVLDNVQTEWKTLAMFNVGLLVFLVFTYSVGCCAARSTRRGRHMRYRAGYRP